MQTTVACGGTSLQCGKPSWHSLSPTFSSMIGRAGTTWSTCDLCTAASFLILNFESLGYLSAISRRCLGCLEAVPRLSRSCCCCCVVLRLTRRAAPAQWINSVQSSVNAQRQKLPHESQADLAFRMTAWWFDALISATADVSPNTGACTSSSCFPCPLPPPPLPPPSRLRLCCGSC